MSFIVLTDADVNDLRDGATINAMADDSTEHVFGPSDLTPGDLDALEGGAELFVGEHRVSYPS